MHGLSLADRLKESFIIYFTQIFHNYSAHVDVMREDWSNDFFLNCPISNVNIYRRNIVIVRNWLRGGMCILLQRNNNTENLPYPGVELQLYHNNSLSQSMWHYNHCTPRYVRDCSVLVNIRQVLRSIVLFTHGSC